VRPNWVQVDNSTVNVPPQAMQYPAVLFDLDGTLIDSNYQHVSTWWRTLREAGITIPMWKIHRRIGMSGKSFMKELLREQSPTRKHDLDSLDKEHDRLFRREIPRLSPLPGANELLRHLSRQQIRIAIATTGGRAQTSRLLGHLRLPVGTQIVTGDDVEKAKPSPDIFVAAAEKLQVPIRDCIVVGDSVWDLLAAGRKSALGIGVLSGGYGEEELERAGAFRVYSDAAEMLEHLEQLGLPGR
jgi:HAD superfamily hydrolase (TIGR01509 family)